MQPDLSAALSRPGAADAFDAVVRLFVEACTTDDPAVMERSGFAFGELVKFLDPASDPRDSPFREPLIVLMRDAAAEAVRVSAGVRRPS